MQMISIYHTYEVRNASRMYLHLKRLSRIHLLKTYAKNTDLKHSRRKVTKVLAKNKNDRDPADDTNDRTQNDAHFLGYTRTERKLHR